MIHDGNDKMSKLLHGRRILFVFGNFDLGGAERQGLLLARCLKDEYGANVQVLGLDEAPGKLSQLCDASVIPWMGINILWNWECRHVFQNLKALWKFALFLRREKPDLLLPYTFFPNIVCGLVWRLSTAKLCVWNQRDEGFFLEREFWRTLAVRLTPLFVANSKSGKQSLLETFAVNPQSISVIPNGVSLEKGLMSRNDLRTRLMVNEDSFVACMVANINANKDHITLLKAWRYFIDEVALVLPSPVLILAGRVDSGLSHLVNLVYSLSLGDFVKFLPEVDDVTGLYEASDLCVYSSKSEGLPNAVLEAMASGLPVVATDIPGIRDAVGPDGYRFLASSGNPKELSERIGLFFKEPTLRTSIGDKMRQRVKERFDSSRLSGRMVSFIAEHWPDR